MPLIEFCRDVLPAEGHYCLFLDPQGKRRHIWFDRFETLVSAMEAAHSQQGVYFGTAAFKEPTNRTQANVRALKSLRLDIDAGPEKFAKHGGEVYETQKLALVALVGFITATTLKPTYTVSSGAGLHIYFCLTEAVSPETWQPLARGLGQLCKQHGLKVDAAVTTDSARVLRPLGTKHKGGQVVTVLRRFEKLYTPEELRVLLPSAETEATTPRVFDTSLNSEVLGAGQLADASAILAGCQAMRDAAATGGGPEPLWRAMLGTLKHCENGEELAHEASRRDVRYDAAETQAKLDRWTAGPATCAEFAKHAPGACSACPRRGKVKSPWTLGLNAPATNEPDNPEGAKAANIQAVAAAAQAAGLIHAMGSDGRLWLTQTRSRHGRTVRTAWPASSEAASDAIVAACAAIGRAPSQHQIETINATARAAAREQGTTTRFYLRAAQIGSVIWLDLGPGRLARVQAEGVELVDDGAPGAPMFTRSSGAAELPQPTLPRDAGAALSVLAGYFQAFFSLDAPQSLLISVLLAEWLRSETPHPLLSLYAGAGSGKSMCAEFIVKLLDPTSNGRTTVTQDSRDFAAVAQQKHVVMVDNVSKLSAETSDLLCIASTGGVMQQRLLYSNGETVGLNLHRAVVLTSVSPVVTAPDLQTRTVQIGMKRPTARRAEGDLRTEFDAAHPLLLGSVLVLLSAGLRGLPEVRAAGVGSQRLADFEQLGEAIVRAAGSKPGTFSQALAQMYAGMVRRSISGDGFMLSLGDTLRGIAVDAKSAQPPTLRAVAESATRISATRRDDGNVTVLARPDALRIKLKRREGVSLPSTGRAFTDALRRVQPMLAAIGVDYAERSSGTRNVLCFDFAPEVFDD